MPREFVRRRSSGPRPQWLSILLGLSIGGVAVLMVLAVLYEQLSRQ